MIDNYPPKASEINLTESYGGFQHSRHRRPSEAGSADRFYGRPCKPNFAYEGYTFHDGEMTPEQIAEYTEAWENETDRKDYGQEPIETIFESDDYEI